MKCSEKCGKMSIKFKNLLTNQNNKCKIKSISDYKCSLLIKLKGDDSMEIKRLPDAEFEIMKIIWKNPHPITTLRIIDQLDPKKKKKWKPQTVLTMLIRLVDKEFLTTEKIGRERNYTPIISEQDYMQVETGNFMSRYAGNSMGSLVKTMYDGKDMSDADIEDLQRWLEEKRR